MASDLSPPLAKGGQGGDAGALKSRTILLASFRNVFKLPPACTLTLPVPGDGAAGAGLRGDTYWRLEYGLKLNLTEVEAEEQLLRS